MLDLRNMMASKTDMVLALMELTKYSPEDRHLRNHADTCVIWDQSSTGKIQRALRMCGMSNLIQRGGTGRNMFPKSDT